MAAKPMLADVELQLVQKIDTEGDQVLAEHGVPGLEGDFLQGLGRRAGRLTLNGVLTGPEAGEGLKTLREKFRAAEPVSFVADISSATKVDKVLIEEMGVRDLAGKPERFEYAFALREFLPPPSAQTEEPPPPPPEPDPPPLPTPEVGTLVVEVIVEGSPGFDLDLSTVRITVEGTTESGSSLARTLQNRSANTWEEQIAPGQYTIRAISNPQGMAPAQIRGGQTTPITITLRSGAVVARQFVVHFRFDRAFVEPCMREVLRRVAARAVSSTTEKLVIVGHADKTGPPDYNQSLSERRARAVHAFLTFGHDRAGALSEWKALRQERKPANEKPSVKDNWGVREYQHMLQDLGFYPGAVDGKDRDLTKEAVREFRCEKGLPPGIATDDPFWEALITDYLAQDSFAVPADRFLTNCPGESLKWLGCGEDDPVKNIGTAHRPSRRVELLFVATNSLPCQVPQPDTFNLPSAGAVNAGWCVGPTAGGPRGCFVSPVLVPGSNKPQPCSTSPTGPWCREPAEPGTITVQGSIKREDGTGVANQAFVLITPNGEFLANEAGNGEPIPARTDSRGNFSFSGKRVGVYSLEVIGEVLVRLAEASDAAVKGNAVCKVLSLDTDHLDVVIINAPLLREIRLPAVARLMTALHPITREIRTCPANVGPRLPQTTAHTAADVRGFFNAANQIWRPARIRFLLDDADIGRETYSFRNECQVDSDEFAFILGQCAYPRVVNVFFFGDIEGIIEAGVYVSFPINGPRRIGEGCAVADRTQMTIFIPPIDRPLTAPEKEQVLAHELGHFLALDHVQLTPASSSRLMLPGTDGANRTLVPAEVKQARTSPNAKLDCTPFSMKVEGAGAARFGTPQSHQFLVLKDAPGVVTVEAVISAEMLTPAQGALTMTGGDPGATPQQRTVGTATTGMTEVVASYAPAAGGDPIISYRSIHVVTFGKLRVELNGVVLTPVGGTGNVFVVRQDTSPGAVITVIAEIAPAPFSVPEDLVKWTGGDQAPDPLRRRVSAGFGETTITALLVPTGTTRSVTINVVRVTLDVDADRDGTVGDEEAGKNTWQFGVGKKGAVILCNNDDDNGNDALDHENSLIDGSNDVTDLAPLIIRRSGPVPAGHTLELSVSDQTKIRIFNQRSTSGTAIIGPAPLPQTVPIANSAAADLEFGMEATQYRGPNFDGLITLKLALKRGNTEVAKDEVKVRVAPWVMPSHLEITEEIYVVNIPFLNTAPDSPFIPDLQSAAAAAGIPLKQAPAASFLHQHGELKGKLDQWMQDCMEVGYSRAPVHAFSVALNAVNHRGLEFFAPRELLGTDYGLHQPPFNPGNANTFDSHGNLEVSPPVTVGSKEFKLGRIYFGKGRSTTPFNNDVKIFLRAQQVQKPFQLDTDWLAVGHVDEIVSFVPSTAGKPFRMLFASTDEALRILNDLQDANHGDLTLFTPFQPRSINGILSNTTLLTENARCQGELDSTEARLVTELGLAPADIIRIPSLFFEETRLPGTFSALIPGMVNMLVITRPTFAKTQLVIPKPFGPVLAGVDQLEKDVRDKLTPLGYAASQIRFVDDFESYHVRLGEVHCGTNSKRKPHTTPWWEQVDF